MEILGGYVNLNMKNIQKKIKIFFSDYAKDLHNQSDECRLRCHNNNRC
jgi:hypothetical protein